jgi:hypothetical protein
MLAERGLAVESSAVWSALPSITSIGKYHSSPAVHEARGQAIDGDPVLVDSTGQELDSQRHKALLAVAGIQYLKPNETGIPGGSAWTEESDIDVRGHEAGIKLAKELPTILARIADRIEELIEAGWKRIVVVTDHGWLLMPGGLPKAGLPPDFTMSKWGRSGVLAPSAPDVHGSYVWPLEKSIRMLTAPGARSFIEGREYSHGGISAQECLIPELVVSSGTRRAGTVEIIRIKWTRLRCEVEAKPKPSGMLVDIRSAAAKPDSSLVAHPKELKDGHASLVVPDEDQEGHAAFVVILDNQGGILAQETTEIGK